jgi:arsenate reductase
MYKVYGIKNCNTVQKALAWLDLNQIDYEFHDVKKDLSQELLAGWLKNLPKNINFNLVVNKKGITFRGLTDKQKALTENMEGAIKVILEKPSVMKRPLITQKNKVIALGFEEDIYQKLFS